MIFSINQVGFIFIRELLMPYSIYETLYIFFILVFIPLGAHEAGHWAVLKRLNVPLKEVWFGLGPSILKIKRFRVGMLPLGAAVVPDEEKFKALTPHQKIAVALGGPVFSFLAAILFYTAPLYWTNSNYLPVAKILGDFNLVIGAFNLIPFPPLDGFQVFVNWKERKGTPFHPKTLDYFYRIGNGVLYGVGFMVIAKLLMM